MKVSANIVKISKIKNLGRVIPVCITIIIGGIMFNALKIRKSKLGNKGFTLIEILIVVMVLGILAMVIIPQITVSTTDAKESTLTTNLSALRSSIELYYHQHNNVYPGYFTVAGDPTVSDATTGAVSFVTQLTQFTNVKGETSTTKTDVFKYGPYLKSSTLPTNPFNDLNSVVIDATIDVITTRTVSGTGGWKFYTKTGILIANDSAAHALL